MSPFYRIGRDYCPCLRFACNTLTVDLLFRRLLSQTTRLGTPVIACRSNILTISLRAKPVDSASGIRAAPTIMSTNVLISRLEAQFNVSCFGRGLIGLWHTTALLDLGCSALRTININVHSPRSATDFDILMASRAASCGIIQSAACLRDEHMESGAGASSLHLQGTHAASLARWRRGQQAPGAQHSPCVILSRTGDVPPGALQHNAEGSSSTAAFCPSLMVPPHAVPAATAAVQAAGLPRSRVVPNNNPGVLAAAQHLRRAGAGRVSIEAGPSTTRSLYDGSWREGLSEQQLQQYGYDTDTQCPVDWLLLSVFSPAPDFVVHPTCVGGVSLERSQLDSLFQMQGAFSEATRDGVWRFALYRNKQQSHVYKK